MFRWVRRSFRRSGGNARELTVAFVVTNILYLSAVVILYSNGDQNRYRFEVSTLYTVLFGLWVSAALKLPGLTKLIAKGSSGPLAADEAMPVGLDLKP